jgi:hypothetical protein
MNCLAFVKKSDPQLNVYLCDAFFESQDLLGEDSQPGTIIHEASHFISSLSLEDLAFKQYLKGFNQDVS